MAKHKPRHKMTKHEMKEDKFVTSMMKGAGYLRENSSSVAIIVILLIAGIAAAVIWRTTVTNKAEAARTKLGVAQIAYRTGSFNESRDSLLALVNKYPESEPAVTGQYLLGHIYYATGKADSASIFWNDFLAKQPTDEDMKAAAEAGLAAIKADNGDLAGAAAEYESLYDKYPAYFDRDRWLFRAGLCYRDAGNGEKAMELLRKYLDSAGETQTAYQAKVILSELEAG